MCTASAGIKNIKTFEKENFMKGIVFSQFLNMVDEKYSIEICERLIHEVGI